MDLTGRISLVRNLKNSCDNDIPITAAADLLDVSLTNIYQSDIISDIYNPIELKNSIDLIHTNNPTYGFRQISNCLKQLGYDIGDYKTKSYMSDMFIHDVSSDKSLDKSRLNKFPNLSKPENIKSPNDIWNIGVTYIRLKYTYVFLIIIIDLFSLFILDWKILRNVTTKDILSILNRTFKLASPKIINSDQGNLFTNDKYINFINSKNIILSMDNKYQWNNNIMNQWFYNLKFREVYKNNYGNLGDAKIGVSKFICNYNNGNESSPNSNSPYELYIK